jgi:tetratricopeptide (TPR) repeat protein
VGSVQAIPSISPVVDNNLTSKEWMRFTSRLGVQYQKVITLLEQGKRKQAKLELGKQIARQPEPRGYEMAGVIFLEDGDNKLALAAFEKAINLDPTSISAHARRGLTLLALGRLEEGKEELLQVLRSEPDNVLALRYMAWYQETLGYPNKALDYYLKVLETGAYQNKTLTSIHLEVARLYNQLGQYKKAIDVISAQKKPQQSELLWPLRKYTLFDSYLSLSKNKTTAMIIKQLETSPFAESPEISLRKAKYALAVGKVDEAEHELQNLIETNGSYLTPASMRLAQLKISQEKPEQAIKVLKKALKKEKESKQVKLLLRGLINLQVEQKQYADARTVLKQQVKKHPDEPYIGYLLYETYLVEGNTTRAMKTLRDTLKRSPDFTGGWYEAGILGRRLNKDEQAEKDFQKVVTLNPNHIDAWVELSRLLFEQGRENEMEVVLKAGVSKNPRNTQLPFELASLYEHQNKSNEANNIYRLILQLYPDHVPALNNLALNLLHDAKNDDEAVKLAKQAHDLLPEEAIPMATYGWVMLLSGDAKKALPLLEKAVAIEKKDIGLQHYLAVAYLKLGKKEAAQELVEKAIKLSETEKQKQILKKFLNQIRSGHQFTDGELRAISY